MLQLRVKNVPQDTIVPQMEKVNVNHVTLVTLVLQMEQSNVNRATLENSVKTKQSNVQNVQRGSIKV
tara:strand:+ start:232 stop:432 length:201 start_codon:yes stop_codon:yes gene_type:complete